MKNVINYQKWAEYQVNEITAHSNPTYLDAAVFKIYDIYSAYNYGYYYLNLAKEKKSNKDSDLIEKNLYLMNSLLYINFCVDYCWQFMFMFSQSNTNSIYNHEDFIKLSKTENLQNKVKDNLIYLKDKSQYIENIDILDSVYDSIKNEIDKTGIRENYNNIKHRGMYYFGLGTNSKTAFDSFGIKATFIDLDGNQTKLTPNNMLYRDSINLDDLYKELYKFYYFYYEQIEKLLTIIPDSYRNKKSNGEKCILNQYDLDDTVNKIK